MAASSVDAAPRPVRTTPVSLAALADGVGRVEGADLTVSGITAASALVRPGDLFAALPGRNAHGIVYAPDAINRGAIAVLTDEAGRGQLTHDLPVVVVPEVRKVLGPLSAQVYGRPAERMTMLGVTGTSGKTTTTFLMRAGLVAAGATVGLIGTVATMIGDETLEAGFTTPEAPELQALLAVMLERGVDTVAMEVSSHALAMGRVDGIVFDVGGFTNLSEDHLDFHADMEEYFTTKAGLLRDRSRRSVVVIDDEWGVRLDAMLERDEHALTVQTTGGRNGIGDWNAFDVVERPDGRTVYRASTLRGDYDAQCVIPGRYNVANALLASAMTVLGTDPAHGAGSTFHDHELLGPFRTFGALDRRVVDAIGSAQVPGRMERIDAGQGFLAVVDYSHKPAAVDGALRALRPLTRGRLIIALGCGGDRDRGKRPHMGEIAARGADVLIVTDDNPRSEDPADIRRAMLAGVTAVPTGARGEVVEIGDRRAAIAEAVARARPGDTVLIAGKGHETGQEVAGTVHPFDDRAVLRAAIEAAG